MEWPSLIAKKQIIICLRGKKFGRIDSRFQFQSDVYLS